MEPQSSLGRVFQVVVQEENQRVAVADQARVSEGRSFMAFPPGFVSTEMMIGAGKGFEPTVGQTKMRGYAASATKEEDNPRSSQMDDWDHRSGSDGLDKIFGFDSRGKRVGFDGLDQFFWVGWLGSTCTIR